MTRQNLTFLCLYAPEHRADLLQVAPHDVRHQPLRLQRQRQEGKLVLAAGGHVGQGLDGQGQAVRRRQVQPLRVTDTCKDKLDIVMVTFAEKIMILFCI